MKLDRVVVLCAVGLIAVFFTWALGHEHVGAQEAAAIEATMQ
jgi:hypothetical protein